jgi:UDP:flavonoid glycosyltransferase YjiC (YdhE family)
VETAHRGRVLIVTWQAGGGVPPAVGLGRLLAARGHEVVVLGPRLYQARIERAGCTWRPIPADAEFDPSAGRAAEEQRTYLRETFLGPAMPAGVTAEVEAVRPVVLVIDAMLLSTVCAAQTLGVPIAALVHTTYRFHGDPEIWGQWGFDEINEMRTGFDQPPISPAGDTVFVEMQRRCDRELVVMPAEFDERAEARHNVVHVGPIFEQDATPADWDLLWAPDDPVPLVVVSLSSQYMHHEEPMERILQALTDLPVHVLATTGLEMDPAEVRVPAGMEVRRYVPHVTVLPHAALVVTHAGTGTLMAALSHAVPLVCIPLGRDQPGNAARAAELGVALALATDAGPDQIRAAVSEALGSPSLRSSSEWLAAAIAGYGAGSRAVEEVDALARSTAGPGWRA